MELKASEFGVVLSVDALKLSRQSPLGVGIGGGCGGGGGSCGGQGGGCGGCSNGCSGGNGGSGGSGSHI
ncbi:microcin B17 [Escherichia coli]|nr:microcin B17 [Escherichia coli]